MLLIVLTTIAVLIVGLVVGSFVRGWMMLPSDRRRISVLAEQLYAQARIDALSRSTIQAARDLVNQNRK